MRLRLVGSSTLDPLAQAIRRAAPACQVSLAPYAQFRQALLGPSEPGIVDVLVTDLDAWIPDGAHGLMALSPADRVRVREEMARDVGAFAAGGRHLVVATLPAPVRPVLGYADWQAPEGESAWIHAANAALAEALRAHPSTRLWDLGGLRAAFGLAASEDPRLLFLGDIRMSPDFAAAAAADLLRLVGTLEVPPCKVLALDLDGTLWGGLAGEEGLGVAVGPESPLGKAFQAFQRQVLSLKRRGVLLVAVSKNDEAAALEILDRHPGMLLRRSDLAAWRINWEDKASNLKALAAELNLGLDSFAFWDDQPFEREWVRQACPGVKVAEVPADPARYASALAAWSAFDASALTEEDRLRGGQYAAERSRRELQASSGTLEDYLASLQTRVRIFRPEAGDLARLVQLFQRTNQFNLTTRRRDEAELKPLLSSRDARVLAMRLTDRFGDQGLVGVAMLERREGAWQVSDFLMSCRVLGRQAETALLLACLKEIGEGKVLAIRVPTAKNGLTADFYPSCGFVLESAAAEAQTFRLQAGKAPAWPAWIVREEGAAHGS